MNPYPLTAAAYSMNAIHGLLQAFPIACLSLTLATDIAYIQTSNLLWLHFSEWLLFAGVVFGTLALLFRAGDFLFRRFRPPWLAILSAFVVVVLAGINSLVHTADGWTAVMPYGLTLSVVTVLAMIVTAVLAYSGGRHA